MKPSQPFPISTPWNICRPTPCRRPPIVVPMVALAPQGYTRTGFPSLWPPRPWTSRNVWTKRHGQSWWCGRLSWIWRTERVGSQPVRFKCSGPWESRIATRSTVIPQQWRASKLTESRSKHRRMTPPPMAPRKYVLRAAQRPHTLGDFSCHLYHKLKAAKWRTRRQPPPVHPLQPAFTYQKHEDDMRIVKSKGWYCRCAFVFVSFGKGWTSKVGRH